MIELQSKRSARHTVVVSLCVCLPPFLGLALAVLSFASAGAQTIAITDRTRFVAKFARTDTVNWLHAVDYSRIVEWRLDTAEGRRAVSAPAYFSVSRKYVWTALDDARIPSMPEYYTGGPTSGITRPEMGVELHFLYNFEGEFVLLSVWDLIGEDSIRYRCAFPTEFYWPNDALWIEKTARFPDSSLLVFLRSTNVMDAQDGDCDWFYRWRQPCEFQLIHQTQWEAVYPANFQRITYDAHALSDTSYRVTEKADFGRLVGNPHGHSMQRDSFNNREIDMWELAVKKFGIVSSPRQ